MNSKIKVAAVSYLNTKPLLYGIEHSDLREEIDLILEYPSLIAKGLIENTIDLGLVPVAVIPEIKNAQIITDFGIAADGTVASVSIFSKKPIEQIERIYLDFQSRTSVKLAQTLIEKYWKLDIKYLPAPENFIELINDTTAAVIIGDRALIHREDFPYNYDLAEYWKKMTGLPFVFATWVANKKLPESFIEKFNAANGIGFKHIPEIIKENPFPYYDLEKYYLHDINYQLNEENRKGLALFLSYIRAGGKK